MKFLMVRNHPQKNRTVTSWNPTTVSHLSYIYHIISQSLETTTICDGYHVLTLANTVSAHGLASAAAGSPRAHRPSPQWLKVKPSTWR